MAIDIKSEISKISQNFMTRPKSNKKSLIPDIIALFLILSFSISVIFFQLDRLPAGLHGDEAWTGIDASKQLREGILPAYVGSAMGQPSLPMLTTSLLFYLFGESIMTVRSSMSIYGIISIALFYGYLRQKELGKLISFVSTIFFGSSLFMIHFSRIGFMLISCVPVIIALFIVIDKFEKRRNILYAFFIGLLIGILINTYNTLLMPALLLMVFVCAKIMISMKQNRPSKNAKYKYLLISIALFVGLFVTGGRLIYLMVENPQWYFGHHRGTTILFGDVYKNLSFDTRIVSTLHNFMVKLFAFTFGNRPDGVDGYGEFHNINFVEFFYFALSIFTLSNKLIKRDKFEGILMHVTIIVLGLIVTGITIDGTYRRAVFAIPSIYFLIALGIKQFYEISKGLTKNRFGLNPNFSSVTLTVTLVISISINLYTYFILFPRTNASLYTFPSILTQSLQVIKEYTAGEPTRFYYYSKSIPCGHETIRFLLKDYPCEYIEDPQSIFDKMTKKRTSVILILGKIEVSDGELKIDDVSVSANTKVLSGCRSHMASLWQDHDFDFSDASKEAILCI